MRVLVVEDERKIASLIERGLAEQGMTVDVCHDGVEGLHLATTREYDVMVLDIMLPLRDGLSVLAELRERRTGLPVILLTARDALSERVEGLNAGADDYVTKPFHIEELVARVHAAARRASGEPLTRRQVSGITLDLLTREVTVRGETVSLTAREFNLLEHLMRAPGRVLTRTQILEHVWGYHFDPQTNLVDVYIQRLRKKLGASGAPAPIDTVRGVGYRFATLGTVD